ncbi:hypothetical protein P7K49_023731 [Saguinus oedipus]|uniref:Uncharacterized protein n=1 Tax=Saguinus oedipus TaxID=9490 RepID=A0ABQ9UNA4_SAGOE|nr:hypothetical protein P7K49_023731 [Saguinus oedipus]
MLVTETLSPNNSAPSPGLTSLPPHSSALQSDSIQGLQAAQEQSTLTCPSSVPSISPILASSASTAGTQWAGRIPLLHCILPHASTEPVSQNHECLLCAPPPTGLLTPQAIGVHENPSGEDAHANQSGRALKHAQVYWPRADGRREEKKERSDELTGHQWRQAKNELCGRHMEETFEKEESNKQFKLFALRCSI